MHILVDPGYPKINLIEDDSLNAFASGINEFTYTVSLSRGIIDKPDDREPEAVIAHSFSLAIMFSTHPHIEKRIALLRQF